MNQTLSDFAALSGNSSIKQPLGASPNTLHFGTALISEKGIIQELDKMPMLGHPQRSIREYIDKSMSTQGK
jgi:hypothetical protein